MTMFDSLSRTWGTSLTTPVPDTRFRPALEALDVREMPAVLVPPPVSPPPVPPPPPCGCECDTHVVCQPEIECHQHDSCTPPSCTSPPPCTTPPQVHCDTDDHSRSSGSCSIDHCGDGRGTRLCHPTTDHDCPDLLCGHGDHDRCDGHDRDRCDSRDHDRCDGHDRDRCDGKPVTPCSDKGSDKDSCSGGQKQGNCDSHDHQQTGGCQTQSGNHGGGSGCGSHLAF